MLVMFAKKKKGDAVTVGPTQCSYFNFKPIIKVDRAKCGPLHIWPPKRRYKTKNASLVEDIIKRGRTTSMLDNVGRGGPYFGAPET